MPEYQFKAMDAGGKVVFGTSSASDQDGLSEILRGQGLFLMECAVNASGHSSAAGAGQTVEAPRGRFALPRRRKRVKLEDVSFFTTQMSVMLQTGLPILESLELLASQTRSPEFRKMLLEIAETVSHGQSLSTAFRRHPEVFDDVYVSLMSAGEASGRLDVMLSRLADYLEFRLTLRRKVRSALLYPAIVITTAMAVVIFMLVFIIPTFVEVFKELGVSLPLPTRILIKVSELVRGYWYLGLAGAGLAIGAHMWRMRRSPAYANRVDRLILATPIIGELVRNITLTRILRTMSSLLESGVTILRTLDLAKEASGNSVFRALLEKVAVEVRDGKVMSVALAESEHVPKLVISMMATGERTGTLPTVINRVSAFYESETNSSISNLFSALEPIFIVVLGIMVGGIAITVLLPMFDLARGIQ